MGPTNLLKQQPYKPFLNKIGQLLETSQFAKFSELMAVFLIGFLLIISFKSDRPSDLLYNQLVVWFTNLIMLAMVFTGLKLRKEKISHFGLSFKKFSWKFGVKTFFQSLLVFILGVAGFVIGSIIMANIVGIPEGSDMSAYNYLKDNIWMLLLSLTGIYVVSSFGEEVIYRAFLINRISELGLRDKKGKILTVLISAIIFGLAHYSWGLMGIVQTGCMGLVLGTSYVYLKKRIWVLIFAHAYMDTVLMLQLYFA